MNQIDNQNHYIKINVTSELNQLGIGSKVTVYKAGTKTILGYDEVRTDFAYRSKRSTSLHFGLGEVEEVDVKLVLRDGRSVTHRGLQVDTEHFLSCP